MTFTALLLAFLSGARVLGAPNKQPAATAATPENRIASVYVSESLINRLIRKHLKSSLLSDVSIELVPDSSEIIGRGLVTIPTEEMKAINFDKGLGEFRFQVTIQPKTTRKGHLVLLFPLEQTFFYPAASKEPKKDRVIVPVQLLSLALASARGTLAALSGDFSGFDRKTRQLRRDLERAERDLAASKDPDERDALQTERRSLQLQLEAVPVERKQLEKAAKALEKLVGFTGEKELNLNQELAAHRNALILRVEPQKFAPYLEGVELGGVRILKDATDGAGARFLALDVEAQLARPAPAPAAPIPSGPPPAQRPPDVVVRLNQALFESRAAVDAEARDLGPHVRNFALELKEDGLHASGDWRSPLLVEIPFTAVAEFVWVARDVFDLRVREVKVAFLDIAPLTGLVLRSAHRRLDKAFKGACTFQYVGEESDRSRAVRVTVNMPGLLPAFPDLTLTGIATKDKELLLKAGTP